MLRCPNHLNRYRVPYPGTDNHGDKQNGVLIIRHMGLSVIFSSGMGWEHVSVSRQSKMPSYEEMDTIKQSFWSEEDCVMQLHVPRADHINCHLYCLHMWRPLNQEIPLPPSILVGPSQG